MGVALAWPAGFSSLGADEEEGKGGQKVDVFVWPRTYLEWHKEFEEKSRAGHMTFEDYRDKVDEFLFIIGPGDNPLVPRKKDGRAFDPKQMRQFDFAPNVMTGIAYYHLGKMDRAKEFLFGEQAAANEQNRGLLYREKINQEAAFLQKTDLELDNVEKFLVHERAKTQEGYQQRIKLLSGYIAELLDKDYDVTKWLPRAEDYRKRLRMVNQVFLQQKQPPKKGGVPQPPKGGALPDPKGGSLPRSGKSRFAILERSWWERWWSRRSDEDSDILLAAADVNSKPYKKSEEKKRKGEDALKKGAFDDAVEHFTDALDFLEAAGADPEEMVSLQKLKEEAVAKAGGGAAPAVSDAIPQADQKVEEVKGIVAAKNLTSQPLRKAKDLLIDARNLYDAAAAPEDKKAAATLLLEDVELQIKDLTKAYFAKVEATPPAPLEDQLQWLRHIELMDPTNQKAKALLPKKFAEVEDEVNRLYRLGMNAYSDEKLKDAIDIWKRAKFLREIAPPPHKRLMSDLARAEQQFKLLKGGG